MSETSCSLWNRKHSGNRTDGVDIFGGTVRLGMECFFIAESMGRSRSCRRFRRYAGLFAAIERKYEDAAGVKEGIKNAPDARRTGVTAWRA